jgi:nicotinamidase-related amidase
MDAKFEPKKTALLTLDVQQGIFGFVAGADRIVPAAAKAAEAARKHKFLLIHVGIGFEPGHPEIGNVGSTFAMVKEKGMFVKGSESAQFHPSVAKPGDLTVYKQRVGAFSENTLHMILRSQGIGHLVLLGISTSGIVLSTIRRAFDLDFHCTVLKDACFDPDEEVHRVLTEKVFARQGQVMTVAEFEAAAK